MKLSEFNKQPLSEKSKYINSFVSGRPGIATALVFQDYSIFCVYSVGGQLLSAEGKIHGDKERADAIKLLKGKEVAALDLSDVRPIKKVITDKLFRANKRYN